MTPRWLARKLAVADQMASTPIERAFTVTRWVGRTPVTRIVRARSARPVVGITAIFALVLEEPAHPDTATHRNTPLRAPRLHWRTRSVICGVF
jgi:hypothetical protein